MTLQLLAWGGEGGSSPGRLIPTPAHPMAQEVQMAGGGEAVSAVAKA